LPIDFLGKFSSADNPTLFELRTPFIIQNVSEESLNKDYDIQQGDMIVSLNGKEIKYADQLIPLLGENANRTIEVELLRDSFKIQKTLNVNEDGKLGFMTGATIKDMIDLGYLELTVKSYSMVESIGVGTNNFISFFGFYLEQFAAIFNPSTGAYKGLGGFLAIGNIFPGTWDWQSFWDRTAILSVMLGVLNLLPIPALDGGHAMFLVYEMVSGRKPSDKFLETVQIIGFIILLSLVIFANGNDIYKLFNFIV
jgi:regulator of sigma E protease